MKRTFVDAGVLIAAVRGQNHIAARAMAILDDPNREFAASDFVKLEVLPKAVYYQKQAEVEFYQAYFATVSHWANPADSLVQKAYREACRAGLAAIDALHVAAAISVQADELVTTEKLSKSIHRTTAIKVVSIQTD
jgi:hypothetical protein